ncbi:MAG: hypothetical protein HC803_08460 [Saprospiraceae bacterium]|nr:hypothetical protein [Saprospiraceae bacterium]
MKLPILLLVFTSFAFTTINDWEIFQSEAGKFQIEMPQLPAYVSKVLDTKNGELTMNAFMHEGEAEVDDNILYMISYIDYPEDQVNAENMDKETLVKFYEGSAKGAASSMDGKITAEAEVEVFGYEGRNFRIDYLDGQAIMRMQVILVKNRIYALQTVALPDNDENAAQNRFFNSFELLND